jgi:RNA polymerase sigma-70 factor (ECF subfamily)
MIKKEEKFKQIVDENKQRVLHICRYYAPTDEDRKDMYQEILINIWKSLDSFRGDSAVSTWVYRIAINTSLSYTGKHYRQMKLNIDADTVNLKNLAPDDDTSVILKENQLEELQLHLNQLSVIDKALMGLVLEDLSTKEISEIIGLTEPNTRVKIHRIKELLQSKIKGGNYGK